MPKYDTLDDALSNVEARFLDNMPVEELTKVERLFFQIEQAHWFYEDYIVPENQHLPHFAKLRTFAAEVFAHCQLLHPVKILFNQLFDDFNDYKSDIPVYGCLLLNKKMNKIVLCKSYKGNGWTFPRGKVNEGENGYDCAIRETEEETGFNASAYGRPEDSLTHVESESKKVQLFIILGAPEEFPYAPLTKGEISVVEFHPLDDVPKGCWGVQPFVSKLRRWIKRQSPGALKSKIAENQRRAAASMTASGAAGGRSSSAGGERRVASYAAAAGGGKLQKTPRSSSVTTTTANGKGRGRGAKGGAGGGGGGLAASFDSRNDLTFADEDGTAPKGRWSVDDMFAANSKLTGNDYSYDGNPHNFGSYHPRYVNYNSLQGPSSSPSPAAALFGSGSGGVNKGKVLLSTLLQGAPAPAPKPAPIQSVFNLHDVASPEARAAAVKKIVTGGRKKSNAAAVLDGSAAAPLAAGKMKVTLKFAEVLSAWDH